ncbi:MAG: hypothetical protein ABIQ40_02290 [Bacteroidia bacterium]
MTQKELKRIFSKGECLSLDALRLYNEGKLSKKSMHEIEMHLLECNLCSGAVDGLNTKRVSEVNKLSEHIQRRLAVYMNTPPRVPFFQRFGLVLITGVILLAAGGTCVYFSIEHKKQEPLSDTAATNKKEEVSASMQQETNSLQSVPATSDNASHAPAENVNLVDDHFSSSSQPEKDPQAPLQSAGFSEKPDHQSMSPSNDEPSTGSTTRSDNSPLRVKIVQVYPSVTHNDNATRKKAKDGQLGKSSANSSSFQMDEMPSFPGGNEALKNYIISNFNPATTDKSKLTKFATGVRFIVNAKTGEISSPEISVSISPEIDKEILRVINSLPDYTPGKKRGEVEVVIGITFE